MSESIPTQTTFSAAHLKHINQKLESQTPERILEWALITLPGLIQTTAFGPTGLVILDMIHRLHVDQRATAKMTISTSSTMTTAMMTSNTPPHSPTSPTVTIGQPPTPPASSLPLSDLEQEMDLTIKLDYFPKHQDSAPHPVPLIFIDTLYHFKETLDLTQRVQDHYKIPLIVYKPQGIETVQEFEARYGEKLWETDELSYDYLIKVEPGRRAYQELSAQAIISGRRRSQKGDRVHLDILEIEPGTGLLKLNPLANWSFQQVWTYLRALKVPYNDLLDKGYKSIGDWHSTKPVNGEDERAGRWAGQQKSECGLHSDYFKLRAEFNAAQKKK